jgi:hypothetical protein
MLNKPLTIYVFIPYLITNFSDAFRAILSKILIAACYVGRIRPD